MPCNCDHMEPTQHERESRKVAQFLVWISEQRKTPLEPWVARAAGEYYGNADKVHELTEMLCLQCQGLPEDFIYNGRDKNARALADWWDAHTEADRLKAEAKKKTEAESKTRKEALKKLSKEERKALGL